MVDLAAILAHLHPQAQPLLDYTVSDDGTGPRITRWSEALGAQPTPEEIAQASAEIEALPVVKQWPSLDFLLRFTQAERIASIEAAHTDAIVADFRSLCASAGTIYSNHPLLVAGMTYLVDQGLLTPERKAEILDE